MTKLLLCLAFVASCIDATPLDPTGTWDMVVHWQPGGCEATGTTKQLVIINKVGSTITATTGNNHETTTGLYSANADEVSVTLTVVNENPTGSGLVTTTVIVIASADTDDKITGHGSANVMGGLNPCLQTFTLTGFLR